jgi:hypothetical protein
MTGNALPLPPPCPCSGCSALAEAIDLDTRARLLVRTIAIKVDRSHGLLSDPPRRRRPHQEARP